MKITFLRIFVLVSLLILGFCLMPSMAQPTGGGPGGGGPPVPIPYVGILIAAGAVYGAKMISDRRKGK